MTYVFTSRKLYENQIINSFTIFWDNFGFFEIYYCESITYYITIPNLHVPHISWDCNKFLKIDLNFCNPVTYPQKIISHHKLQFAKSKLLVGKEFHFLTALLFVTK